MTTAVGIMSMQRIHNYGSSLQAYGLRRLLEALSDDITVSFVDYEPGDILIPSAGTTAASSRFGRTVSKVAEYNDVDATWSDKLRFFNHKRTYGRRYFPMIGITPEPNRDLALHVQVIGSDEVFNCVQSNTRVGYSRDLFGHNSPAGRVVSYAASFGNTTIDKIQAAGIRDQLAEDLGRFSAVSVRDRNSAGIVEHLIGTRPPIHVDPVLAYDFSALETRVPPQRLFDGKYIIVYGYAGRLSHEENEILKRYASRLGATILCFGGVQECCDRFVDCSPFELLAFFRDAEAIVTDTFHGTILAIINEKPFGAIIRPSVGHGYGNEEKLGFLLDTLGLESQKVTDLSGISEVLDHEVDFGVVAHVLTHERTRTHEYLSEAVL